MNTIDVLLVDDQVLFVENLKLVLDNGPDDIRVVGVIYDGRDSIHAARRLRPEIILMDVRMPGMDGVEAAKHILAENPRVKVVMLTVFDDDDYVFQALEYGAVGYLLKNLKPDNLFTAIRAVHDGEVLMSPSVAQRIFESKHRKEPHGAGENVTDPEIAPLSKREIEVLKLVADEYSNKAIAEALFLSERTVKNYVSKLYDKLCVSDRFEAIRKARTYFRHRR